MSIANDGDTSTSLSLTASIRRLPSPQRGRGAGGEGDWWRLQSVTKPSTECGPLNLGENIQTMPAPSPLSRVGARGTEVYRVFSSDKKSVVTTFRNSP